MRFKAPALDSGFKTPLPSQKATSYCSLVLDLKDASSLENLKNAK